MVESDKSVTSIFTKIINREIASEIIYETNKVIVIKDIFPQATIHFLIIPKFCFKDISDIKEQEMHYLLEMFLAAQHLAINIENCYDYKLIINNGKKAGQCIFHLHMHFLSGF